MGVLQNGFMYQTPEKFAEKSERFGRFSRFSGHMFHKCGQLRSSAEFLLVICLYAQQISTDRGERER